jgi:tetrahydromethanopterin S-methyltransferase subunit G
MEAWQFSLFFAALLVGYALVHLRIVRFEEHLRGLAQLRSIDEKLEQMQRQVQAQDPEQMARIEARLDSLREAIEDLRETAQHVGERLGEAIVRIPQPVAAAPSAVPAALPQDRVRAMVETRLVQLGYSNLRLLTDLSAATLDGEFEVQVECERRHMPYKGRVLLHNGALRDVALQSVATLFP